MAMVAHGRIDLTSLITHRFALDDIREAYDLFSRQGDGVLKVALFPQALPDCLAAPEVEEAIAHMGV